MTKSKEYLKRHIKKIIENLDYENMKKKYPDYCPCLNGDPPCHDIKDLNCLLCYCPEYDTRKEEGGCKIENPKGKFFWNPNLPKGKIWDCSDCNYPHEKKNIRKYLEKLFNL